MRENCAHQHWDDRKQVPGDERIKTLNGDDEETDRPGRVSRRERLRRGEFLTFFAQQPAATVVMEACGSAHYWGRRIGELGHRVVLLSPHQVRPYVRRNKTDRTDAKGILEASRNEDIHPVPVKTVSQQVLTSLHGPTDALKQKSSRQGLQGEVA